MAQKRFKYVSLLLLCLILSVSIVACGAKSTATTDTGTAATDSGTAEPTPDPNKAVTTSVDQLNGGSPITLKVDLWGFTPTISTTKTKDNPNVRIAAQKIADAFTKLYPNVKIEWVRDLNKSDLPKLTNYYTVKLASDDAPDIGMSWNNFKTQNWYLPLDDILSQPNPFVSDNQHWKDQYPDYLWDRDDISSVKDGKKVITALPITLFSGPPTAIYYNKSIFAKENIQVPTSYGELLKDIELLNSKGYIGIRPWQGMKQIYDWALQFNLGPYYAKKNLADKADYNKDGKIDQIESLRAVKEGLYSPVLNDYARELYQNMKKFFAAGPKNWETTDFTQQWIGGKIAMYEDGTWQLQPETSNTERKFDFGLFPPLTLSAQESSFVSPPEFTTAGPYQPQPMIMLNIFKPSVDKHGTEKVAVRFLQFLTAPDNLSLIVNEDQTSIGAVKGVQVPVLLKDWLSHPFPKQPQYSWPSAYDAEGSGQWNQYFTAWVNNKLTDDQLFKQMDDLQTKSANRYLESQKIDTKGWNIVLK